MTGKRPSVALLTTFGSVIVAGAAWYYSTGSSTPPTSVSNTLPATFPLKITRSGQMITVTRLTPVQIEEKLSSKAFSVKNNPSSGIFRWDVSQVNSNEPVEDFHSEFAVLAKSQADRNASFNGKMFWGVFDGHGGWQCSQKVAQDLPLYCATAISQAEKSLFQIDEAETKEVTNLLRNQVITQALTSAFLNLDNDIVNGSLTAMAAAPHRATELLLPALAGSCALLAHIDIAKKDLYIAWVGDSRAVLGTVASDTGEIKAVPLSRDQTGRDPDEIARIRAEHPGEEETAVWRGRVLGSLEPSRSFGDSRYKWDIKTHQFIVKRLFDREMPRGYLTPPYVNANPGITHHKLRPEDKFLVLATDGLYDKLDNDQIVTLVADWMRQRNLLPKSTGPSSPKPSSSESSNSANRQWSNRDDNVATHLIRNALGGSDEEELSKILSIPAPHSRRYRDDITVTVVFFGEGDASPDISKILVPSEVRTIKLDVVEGEKGAKPLAKL